MDDKQLIAAAIKALDKKRLENAFDPYRPDSRPNDKQLEYLQDLGRIQYRFLVAGNQCLAKGTKVLTPKGILPIEKIVPGDFVYDHKGNPIKVLNTFSNGPKEVVELTNRGQLMAESTIDHVWQTLSPQGKVRERKVSELVRDEKICRVFVKAPLGTKEVPDAYVLGALLGDGCSRQAGNKIHISGTDEEIIKECSSLLGGTYVKSHPSNHTWKITSSRHIAYYREWCKGRYAHEKIIDLEEIRTWDRTSVLKLVAGLLDTDGSVYLDSWNTVVIQFGMQALSVVEAMQWALLTLWQIPVTIHVDNRDKYKNGPVYYVRCANNALTIPALKEVSAYMQVERKQWKQEYETLLASRSRADAIEVKLGASRIVDTYDIHVDSPENLYLLANGMVTHNSGKSQTVAREIAWILNNNHPYWKRPVEWNNEPLMVLLIGQDLTMIGSELWEKKIKPFMDMSVWKEERQGNTIKKVVNTETKDQIIFLSHSDGSDKNRKHMQGYTAHIVMVDEMPANPAILEESQLRVQSKKGFWSAAFTPKFRNDRIRKIVDDSVPPLAKKYKMSKFDNPIFKDSFAQEMQRLAHYSESERNSILFGEWSIGDNAVYKFDYDLMTIDSLPEGYHRGWRHVVSVDPALKSLCGFTLWTEDPVYGTWYLISDEYVKGSETLDPESLYNLIEKRIEGYNIVRRITDSMAWFTSVASKHGRPYLIPYSKTTRKDELIKNLQLALSNGKIKILRSCSAFIDEIQSCQFREESDVIVNSSIYHTLDASQYFVDLMPKFTGEPVNVLPIQQAIYEAHIKELHRLDKQKRLQVKNKRFSGRRR